MHAFADRLEFAPPPQPGLMRSFVLAVLAHVLLVLALMHGLRWTRESQDAAVEAELWSAVPQQAAPREVPVPPPAPPQPTPPVVKAPPEPPAKSEADIALEREKQKRAIEQQRREEELQRQRVERAERAKIEAQKKREDDLARKKQEQAKELADARRKADEDKERKAKQQQQAALDERKRQQLREDTLKRMQTLAGGTGAPTSTGTAARSSGPSANWAGRVVGRVRPNIVYTGERSSAWHAEVEVKLSPDGTIVSRRITKSNAPAPWNEAVLRALDRTEVLPRDTDGTVPRQGTLVFTPD